MALKKLERIEAVDAAIERSYNLKVDFSKVRNYNDGEEEYDFKEITKDLGNGYSATFQDRPSEQNGSREIDVTVHKDGALINGYDVTMTYDGSRGGQMVAENRAVASIRDILKDYRKRNR